MGNSSPQKQIRDFPRLEYEGDPFRAPEPRKRHVQEPGECILAGLSKENTRGDLTKALNFGQIIFNNLLPQPEFIPEYIPLLSTLPPLEYESPPPADEVIDPEPSEQAFLQQLSPTPPSDRSQLFQQYTYEEPLPADPLLSPIKTSAIPTPDPYKIVPEPRKYFNPNPYENVFRDITNMPSPPRQSYLEKPTTSPAPNKVTKNPDGSRTIAIDLKSLMFKPGPPIPTPKPLNQANSYSSKYLKRQSPSPQTSKQAQPIKQKPAPKPVEVAVKQAKSKPMTSIRTPSESIHIPDSPDYTPPKTLAPLARFPAYNKSSTQRSPPSNFGEQSLNRFAVDIHKLSEQALLELDADD